MKPKNEETPDTEQKVAAQRREFLKSALRAAAYAAPVVAMLSMRNMAAAAQSPHSHP